jgi:hypothetical protein
MRGAILRLTSARNQRQDPVGKERRVIGEWQAVPEASAADLCDTAFLRGRPWRLVERFITVGGKRYAEMRVVKR